jgi:DNA-binding protein H-NS
VASADTAYAWHSASITTGEIKVASLESLQAKIKMLEGQAEALIAKQASGVIEKIRDLMEKHGLTTADIDAHAGGKQRGTKVRSKAVVKTSSASVKYRALEQLGPGTVGHRNGLQARSIAISSWSMEVLRAGVWHLLARRRQLETTFAGRGRRCTRTRNRGRRGADAVSKARGTVKKASAEAGAAVRKGQLKGPQPALNRDPKSGATSSGRGRAPAWLAGAKDSSKFLIDAAAA